MPGADDREGLLRLIRLLVIRRRLLAEIIWRDVRGRFAGSRLGLAWSLVTPLVQLASYALIFGFLYRVPSSRDGKGALLAMLFCGLWPWWAFQEASMRGLTAIVDWSPILRKTPLSPDLCVLGAVMAAYLLQTIGFLIFLVLFLALGIVPVSGRLVLLPCVLVVGLLLAGGVGLVLSPLYLLVRDTVHVATAGFTVLFFLSPVLYDPSSLPISFQFFVRLNPVAGLIALYRAAILGGTSIPSVTEGLAVTLLSIVILWSLGILLIGRLRRVLDEYL